MVHRSQKQFIIFFTYLVLIGAGAAGQSNPDARFSPNLKQLINRAENLVKVATNYDTVTVLLNRAEKLLILPENSRESIHIKLIRGLNESNENDYEQAVQFYFNALDDAENTGDSVMAAKADFYLGKVFDEMEDFNEAISYFQHSINICENNSDSVLLAKSYQNIAISYQNKKELDKAIEFNRKAEHLAEVRKDTVMLVDVTNNFGTIAYDQKDLPKAMQAYQKALELYRKINDQQGIAMAYNNIGLVFFDKKEYSSALKYFNQALDLAMKLKMYDFIGDIYSNLTIYYAEQKDYRNAYHFYDLYNTVYDSLAGEKKTKMIRIIQAKYQVHKARRDMEALQEKNNVQLKSIDNAKLIQAYLIGITAAIILLMISTIYLLIREKRLARALKVKTKELLELNNTKDKFFSIVAHDLRNPFNILVSYTNLLKTNFDSFSREEVQQIVTDLSNASESGYNLLQNLLLWSRTQTNRLHVFKTSFNLLTIVNQVRDLVEFNLTDKNQQLIVDIKPDLVIFADKDMISTVLRNLVFNAIKFSAKGSQIRIKSTLDAELVRIDVIDSGIGISTETQKKLFALDYNSSTKGTEGESGSGLGLVISREFVEMNGGKIWVESTPGKGSTFSFTLLLKSN